MQIHDELKPGDMKKAEGDDPCDADRYAIMAVMEHYETIVKNYWLEANYPKPKPTLLEKAEDRLKPGLIMPEREPEIKELY